MAIPLIRLLAWKKPDAFKIQDYRLYLVIQVIASLGLTVHCGFSLFFLFIQIWPMVAAHVFGVLVWLICLWANRKGQYALSVVSMTSDVAFQAILATYLLGWNTGFYFYMMAAIPISFLNPARRERINLVALLCGAMGICILLQVGMEPPPISLSKPTRQGLNMANVALSFAALGLSCNYFRHASLLTERQIFQLANTDDLTGLLNRRKMQDVIQDQVARVHRYGDRLTFILVDIDRFKSINDTYGHSCGDHVLQEFSLRLLQTLRQTDWVCRWGGEEFLILLPNTDQHRARMVAEKLKEAIATQPILYQDQSLTVTATFGVAEYHIDLTIEQVLNLLDERLYIGKRNGRNRIEDGALSQASL